ncbi:unnamed protein product [Brassica oleracea]
MAAAFLNIGSYVFVFFLSSLATLAPQVQANIAVFDDYWTQRQGDALKQTLASFDPYPLNVTNHLNYHVALALDTTGSINSTRRELSQARRGRKMQNRRGKCVAHNPIDKCWRCDRDWEKNRKKLAVCALGFGRRTSGGKDGPIYVVTDASDDELISPRPGTLRHAVTRDGPLWIIFARSMVIKLQQELMMTSDKTIDGRGARVYIMGGSGLTLQFVNNVIVMLFGANDKHEIDKKMQITVAFNHFGKRLEQRMPRVRFGTIHVVNNDYTHWEMYAIGGNMNPTIISHGNRFIAPPNEQAKQITKREYTSYVDWKLWNWQSEGDYFLNGAYFVQSGKPNAWSPKPKNPIPNKFAIRPKPGTMVRKLTMDAGVLGCKQGNESGLFYDWGFVILFLLGFSFLYIQFSPIYFH